MPPLIPTILTCLALVSLLAVGAASEVRSRRLLASWLSPVIILAAGLQTAVLMLWTVTAVSWMFTEQIFPGLIMLIAVGGMGLLWHPGTPSPALANGPELRVMTVNALNINMDFGAGIAAEIRAERPHIVLIQEYSRKNSEGIDTLADIYPYRFVSDYPVIEGTFDLAIFSSIPLQNERHVFATDGRPVLLADLTWDGRTITVAAIHTLSPTDRHRAGGWVDELDAFPDVFKSDLPMIVGGDFNAVPGHAPFRDMLSRSGLRDLSSGIKTWPNYRYVPAVWQLDHVLASSHWQLIGRPRTGIGKGSDHKPVTVHVKLH